ncbi:hypothetical protein [Crocinitomix algicola]|uniref:hypothetical protein n=1 Tax=Crocinitomix algicola TaxID=1740263 RepID=UPI0008347136|nr:hypothetical protein [Crocinitomix algicola]
MKSIKNFEGKKLVNEGINQVKGGERTPTANNDLVIVRGDKVKYKTNHDLNPFNNDGWSN